MWRNVKRNADAARSFLLYRKLLSYGFGNENSPLENRALEIDVSDLENIESFFIKIVLIDIIEFM